MTPKYTFPFALLTLVACASDPELIPADLGSPCQIEAFGNGLRGFRAELNNVQCMGLVCVADLSDDDYPTYPTTREECEAMPEMMGECDDYQPAALYEEQVYCSCQCPDRCACDAPGYECRPSPSSDLSFCVKSE